MELELETKKQPTRFNRLGLFSQSLFIFILLTLIGSAIGCKSSEFQSEQWQAEVKLEEPVVQDLGNYYALATTYDFLQGKSERRLTNNVYQEFLLNLSSQDVLTAFLAQHEIVKKYASDHKQLVEAVLPHFIEGFASVLPKYNDSSNATFTWQNAEQAKILLNDYIQFAGVKARESLNGELITKWKVLFQQVKFSAENQLGAVLQGDQIAQQDWNGKLNLMRAVQPLDDKLVPYRITQSVTVKKAQAQNQIYWGLCGGVIGVLLALLFIGFSRVGRQSV
ncbi:hypothetical protein [Ursidibacter arcticus]